MFRYPDVFERLVAQPVASIAGSYTRLSVRQAPSRGHCVSFLQLHVFTGFSAGAVFRILLLCLLMILAMLSMQLE